MKDINLRPTTFPEANYSYGAPPDWDSEKDGECGALPLWKIEYSVDAKTGETVSTTPQMVSCWELPKMSLWQRLKFAFSGKVWLTVTGAGHPPVSLNTECPFQKSE